MDVGVNQFRPILVWYTKSGVDKFEQQAGFFLKQKTLALKPIQMVITSKYDHTTISTHML